MDILIVLLLAGSAVGFRAPQSALADRSRLPIGRRSWAGAPSSMATSWPLRYREASRLEAVATKWPLEQGAAGPSVQADLIHGAVGQAIVPVQGLASTRVMPLLGR
jgi:hypothetical protein